MYALLNQSLRAKDAKGQVVFGIVASTAFAQRLTNLKVEFHAQPLGDGKWYFTVAKKDEAALADALHWVTNMEVAS